MYIQANLLPIGAELLCFLMNHNESEWKRKILQTQTQCGTFGSRPPYLPFREHEQLHSLPILRWSRFLASSSMPDILIQHFSFSECDAIENTVSIFAVFAFTRQQHPRYEKSTLALMEQSSSVGPRQKVMMYSSDALKTRLPVSNQFTFICFIQSPNIFQSIRFCNAFSNNRLLSFADSS